MNKKSKLDSMQVPQFYDDGFRLELLKRLDDDFDHAKNDRAEFEYYYAFLNKYFEAHKQNPKSISLMGTGVAVGYVNKIVNHIIANSINKSSKWMLLQCGSSALGDEKKIINGVIQRVQEFLYGVFSNGNTRFYYSVESAIRNWYIYGTGCLQIKYNLRLKNITFINIPMNNISFDVDKDGLVNQVFRDIRISLREAFGMWGDMLHGNQLREIGDPLGNHKKECHYREYIVLSSYYPQLSVDEVLRKSEYIRIVADVQNKHIISIEPLNYMPYTVFRFAEEIGSIYGKSNVMQATADLICLYEVAADIKSTSKMLAHPAYLTKEKIGIRTVSPSDLIVGLDMHGASAIQPFHIHNQNISILYEYYQTKKTELQGMLNFDMLMIGINPTETATAIQAKKAQAVDALSPIISSLESELLNPLIKNMIKLLLSLGSNLGLDEESYLIFTQFILPQLEVYCVGESKQIQNMYVLQNMMSWYNECLQAAQVNPDSLMFVKFPELIKKIGELRGAGEELTRSYAEVAELKRLQEEEREKQRQQQQHEEITQSVMQKMDYQAGGKQ